MPAHAARRVEPRGIKPGIGGGDEASVALRCRFVVAPRLVTAGRRVDRLASGPRRLPARPRSLLARPRDFPRRGVFARRGGSRVTGPAAARAIGARAADAREALRRRRHASHALVADRPLQCAGPMEGAARRFLPRGRAGRVVRRIIRREGRGGEERGARGEAGKERPSLLAGQPRGASVRQRDRALRSDRSVAGERVLAGSTAALATSAANSATAAAIHATAPAARADSGERSGGLV
mmetsp:Transcript_5482/g.15882  ORF Transcript_5482/g.15882 Transcript_5482/m.15882 type:complete len:238 (-) Transcript_5482:239-952(-)